LTFYLYIIFENYHDKNTLQAFQVIDINFNIAKIGGLFKRDDSKQFGVGLADALIAASAHNLDAKLITLNKKHFPMLKNILVPYQKN